MPLNAVLAALRTQGAAAACRDVAQPALRHQTAQAAAKHFCTLWKPAFNSCHAPPAASWQKQGAYPDHLSPPVSRGTLFVKGRVEAYSRNYYCHAGT